MTEPVPCLVDTHCHLDFDVFNENRPEVRAFARQAGICRIVNPGVDVASSQRAIELAETCDEVYAAVGVHPNDAATWNESTLRELRDLARHPKVVAIGEIGLDYYWNKASHVVQKRIFRQQLELAAEFSLPVILHSREANSDILSMITDWHAELLAADADLASRPGVLHSFSGDLEQACQAFENGFWIGIGGPLTFKNAPQLQSVVTQAPLDRLLLETDAPFLTPHPFRGKRNEPGRVRLVAEKMADLKGLPYEEIARRTTANARQMFQWREDF